MFLGSPEGVGFVAELTPFSSSLGVVGLAEWIVELGDLLAVLLPTIAVVIIVRAVTRFFVKWRRYRRLERGFFHAVVSVLTAQPDDAGAIREVSQHYERFRSDL